MLGSRVRIGVRVVRISGSFDSHLSTIHSRSPKGSLELDVWHLLQSSLQGCLAALLDKTKSPELNVEQCRVEKCQSFHCGGAKKLFQDSKRRSRFHSLSLSLSIYLSIDRSLALTINQSIYHIFLFVFVLTFCLFSFVSVFCRLSWSWSPKMKPCRGSHGRSKRP